MNYDFAIQTATIDDLDNILDLEETCFPEDPFPAELFEEALETETGVIRIIRDADELIAFCMLSWDENESLVNLSSLAVHPYYRGMKISHLLLDDAEETCLQLFKYFIFLEVRATNETAIRLYEKHGYELHEEIPEYYLDGETAYRYVKYLGP